MKTALIAPTTEASASVEFGIPPLVWSPDADVTRGVTFANGTTVVNDYPGRALQPREFTLVLHAEAGGELPASAEACLEVRTGTDANGEPHFEPIRILTSAHKALRWGGPIEGMRVRKAHSDTPFGVTAFGLFGETTTTTS